MEWHGIPHLFGSMRGDGQRAKQTLTVTPHPHLVIKVAIQAQDVGVPQVRLDLDLTPQLMLHVRLLQLSFEQHLRRAMAGVRVFMWVDHELHR